MGRELLPQRKIIHCEWLTIVDKCLWTVAHSYENFRSDDLEEIQSSNAIVNLLCLLFFMQTWDGRSPTYIYIPSSISTLIFIKYMAVCLNEADEIYVEIMCSNMTGSKKYIVWTRWAVILWIIHNNSIERGIWQGCLFFFFSGLFNMDSDLILSTVKFLVNITITIYVTQMTLCC